MPFCGAYCMSVRRRLYPFPMPTLIQALRADITKLPVQAIVNAANASLLAGCETGDAKLTQGYGLAAHIAVATARSAVQTFTEMQEVVFCCFSDDDLAIYERILHEPAAQ